VLITRTPLRISLLGGGTDLPKFYENHDFGQVLSFSISKYIYLSIHPLVEDEGILLKYSKQEFVSHATELVHPIAREVLSNLGIKGVDISVTSDIPAGTGMGSSSAFTVGMYQLIFEYLNQSINQFELAKLACELEITKLNQPIGKQDQFACSMGGINVLTFRSNQDVEVKSIDLASDTLEQLNADLLLVRVGEKRSATTLLSSQSQTLSSSQKTSDLVESYIKMRDLVKIGESELRAGNLVRLGEVISESWEIKKSFDPGISNSLIDRTIQDGERLGAYGAKLLGAGGSGYVLMLAPVGLHPKFLDSFQGRILKPRVDFDGTKVIYKSE
jgi:D-glycero-alpha-D-manno-heptose-7-phosphate kinase